MPNTTTYVTAFINLPRLESNAVRRPLETYQRVADELLRLDINLVYIGDAEMAQLVKEARERYGLLAKTVIIPMTFEELPYYKYHARITDVIRDHGIFNLKDCKRYTPSYTTTILSKVPLLQRVAHENPFATSHFCWIDFGYFHLKETYPYMFYGINETLFNNIDVAWTDTKVKIQMIQTSPPHIVNLPLKELISADRNTLAGGIFGGSPGAIDWLAEQQENTVCRALAENTIANEEMILTYVLYKNPERFDINGAYYASILQNFAITQMNYEKVVPVLSFFDQQGWGEHVLSVCWRTLAGHQQRCLALSDENLSYIYGLYAKYTPADKQAAIRAAAAGGGDRWEYHQNMDSLFGDIRKVATPFTLVDLIEAAESTEGCVGFTSTGWLKREIHLRKCDGYASGAGIYVLRRTE